MTRTKLIEKKGFKSARKLETMTDEDGVLWVQTYPGNWEKHSIWEEQTNQKKETLKNTFENMKRKEFIKHEKYPYSRSSKRYFRRGT